MFAVQKMFIDGVILSCIASLFIVVSLYINPRIWLQDYPEDIQNKVPPKTRQEKRLSLYFGIPFLILLLAIPFISTLSLKHQLAGDVPFLQLFLNAFGVAVFFNVIDLLVLDWLIFCTITPTFIVIPGTEGLAGYKDYYYHFRASIIGMGISLAGGLAIAGIVSYL